MKTVHIFGGAEFVPRNALGSKRRSGFGPISESLIEWWTAARKKFTRRLGRIRNNRQAGSRSQINRSTRSAINIEQLDTGARKELEFLAGGIILLARQIQEQNQRAPIAVEEASLALHFRKTKEEIRQSLMLLERQGRAKRSGLEGHWIFLV